MTLQPIPIQPDHPDMPLPAAPFQLELDVFAGPLDLLLHLIESRQLDVLTVPLSEMADAYVAHLGAHPVPPDQLADFISIASQLILLKSRSLLPTEPLQVAADGEEEPNEEELRRRLLEYRALRDAARGLGERDLAAPLYRREPRESDLREAPTEPLSPAILAAALDRLAAIPEPAAPPPEVVPREVTIGMQIEALRAAMGASGRVIVQHVLAACRSRTQVTVTVLAMLELVRRRQARVEQDELFGPILLETVPREPAK
jgi:segregation and condensation protein A